MNCSNEPLFTRLISQWLTHAFDLVTTLQVHKMP